jgi:hypothetical protein
MFYSGFPPQIFAYHSSLVPYLPPYLDLIDLIILPGLIWWRQQIAKLLCVLSFAGAVYTPKHNTWRSAVSECLVDKCQYRLGASWRNETVLTNTLLSCPYTLVPRGEPRCFYRQGTLCMTSYCTPALTNRYTRISTPRCNYSQAESEKFPACSK